MHTVQYLPLSSATYKGFACDRFDPWDRFKSCPRYQRRNRSRHGPKATSGAGSSSVCGIDRGSCAPPSHHKPNSSTAPLPQTSFASAMNPHSHPYREVGHSFGIHPFLPTSDEFVLAGAQDCLGCDCGCHSAAIASLFAFLPVALTNSVRKAIQYQRLPWNAPF